MIYAGLKPLIRVLSMRSVWFFLTIQTFDSYTYKALHKIHCSKQIQIKVDDLIWKVYAYQKMRKDLKLYHATYYADEREAAKQQISDFAVANDFVTEFTSLVVVQAQENFNFWYYSLNNTKLIWCFW